MGNLNEFDVSNVISIVIVIVIIILLNEISQTFYRNYNRGIYYKKALDKSLETKKPLIVIGCPHNHLYRNLHREAYGPGNFTIDKNGCSKGICKDIIERDLLKSLRIFEDNSCIIFINCFLEYENNIEEVIKEIKRVSGSIDNIFTVIIGTSSIASYYSLPNISQDKDIKQVFIKVPPEGNFEYQKVKK